VVEAEMGFFSFEIRLISGEIFTYSESKKGSTEVSGSRSQKNAEIPVISVTMHSTIRQRKQFGWRQARTSVILLSNAFKSTGNSIVIFQPLFAFKSSHLHMSTVQDSSPILPSFVTTLLSFDYHLETE
jgi:hypothetical protein